MNLTRKRMRAIVNATDADLKRPMNSAWFYIDAACLNGDNEVIGQVSTVKDINSVGCFEFDVRGFSDSNLDSSSSETGPPTRRAGRSTGHAQNAMNSPTAW